MASGAYLHHLADDSGRRRSWSALLTDVPAWGISLGIHLVMLLLLGTITRAVVNDEVATITSTVIDEEISPDVFKLDTIADQIGSDSLVNTMAASQEAATALGHNPHQEMERKIEDNFTVETPRTDVIVEPPRANLIAAVNVKGANVHPGGVEGAVDRLAFEIAGSLRERKTLVIWLFDNSPSLASRRKSISNRFENVYKQLGQFDVGADRALKTAVVSFSHKTNILTPEPLDDVPELTKIVREIKSESTGDENVFGAVQTAIAKWKTYRTGQHRNMMVVIVTDEAGSDPDKLEAAITEAKRLGIRCYCVGDAAPFGKKTIEIPFTLESGEAVIGVMEKGPEAFFPERVQLGYWGANGSDLEELSSGFGPYALTRLCSETNGLFLVADQGRGYRFDPETMRDFAPDYRPIPELMADLNSNLAKKMLVQVAEQSRIDKIAIPRNTFRAETDTILRQEITEAQKPLAVLDYALQKMLDTLEAGEKDRPKIKEARWRASYDLAMGRVLAMRARAFGYNTLLAEMKSTPKKFEKKDSNLWHLVPSKDITAGANVKKLGNKATEYLKRVIDENPGTPWEKLAARELSVPLGWAWREGHYDPPKADGRSDKEKLKPKFEELDPKTGKKKSQMPTGPVRRDI